MNEDLRFAQILAALELVPGDASDVTPFVGRVPTWSDAADGAGSSERGASVLEEYLEARMDVSRVEYWEKRLHELRTEFPNVRAVAIGDSDYPRNLAAAYDAPPILFFDGDLKSSETLTLAVVGTRTASSVGLEAAYAVGANAIDAGATIVSGLARGIDTAAHKGALDVGGRTIAVLPCGIDRVFPAENEELARLIADKGCLVSQFQPGAPPARSLFLKRNAVISGLSRVSLVIEANERSGSRNEAGHALGQGRQVMIWEPVLGSAPWARRFANEPGVSMVSDVEEVFRCLHSSPIEV